MVQARADPGLERFHGGEGIGDRKPGAHIEVGKGYVPRGARIGAQEGRRYGLTEGCPGCTWHQSKLGPQRMHSDTCRRSFEELLAENKGDRDKVQRATARREEWTTDKAEEDDKPERGTMVQLRSVTIHKRKWM